MRISDWSSDVCSSDLLDILVRNAAMLGTLSPVPHIDHKEFDRLIALNLVANQRLLSAFDPLLRKGASPRVVALTSGVAQRSEEHTSELQSLMRISYAVFCWKQKKQKYNTTYYKYT